MSVELVEKESPDAREKENKKNRFVIVKGSSNSNPFALEAAGDRIFVLEDKFKTGYECKECGGDGFIPDKECPLCKGTGQELDNNGNPNPETFCRSCCRERGTLGLYDGKGKLTCEACKGKGALLAIPQSAAQRPTTGVIMSKGADVSKCPDCRGVGKLLMQGVIGAQRVLDQTLPSPILVPCLACEGKGKVGFKLELGDRVLYPIFAGTAISFKQRGVCRIMHENEIYGKVYGYGDLGDMVK